jgi:predicted CXXCH cytochrome family protein
MRIKFCLKNSIIILTTVFFSGIFLSYAHAQEQIISIDAGASCVTASCHFNMGKKKSVHKIGVDGKLCIICHEIAEEGKHIFAKIPDDTGLICAKCHSKETEAPAYIKDSPPKVISQNQYLVQHEPFKEGKCTKCHDAHESNYFNHLKAEYTEDSYAYYEAGAYSLCLNGQCHEGLEETFRASRTLSLTKFRNGNLNLHFRHVNKIKGRSCKVCHQPHASEAPRLIRSSFKFGKRELTINYEMTETGGGCKTTCHRSTQYDRYNPVSNLINVSPRPGEEATLEELQLSREKDMQERKAEGGTEQQPKEDNAIQEQTDANK